jgi:hypothetical protein
MDDLELFTPNPAVRAVFVEQFGSLYRTPAGADKMTPDEVDGYLHYMAALADEMEVMCEDIEEEM